ncbi:MAG: hypothetical protein IBX52_10955 [Bacterioplanes sp.]|nr:hypothetical protein [Bacterioplanes sp.]
MANCLNDEIALGTLSAVHAGKEVTAHEKPLNFYGKTSAGYIILDPTTGAGAYMISSGENGGELSSDAPFSLLTGLMDAKDGLWKYFGSFINKVKQIFDFALDAENCGLGFAVVKFLSMLVMAIGLTYLLMPYFMLLSLGAALAYVTVLRILVIEVLLSGYFSSQFTCKE